MPRRPTETAHGVSFSAERRGDLTLAEWFSREEANSGC